jgi:hypothetical protein
MRGQYSLVQTILFFSTVGLVAWSYCLSIKKPIVMLPCNVLALLSLAVLVMFTLTEPRGAWFLACVLYTGVFAGIVALGWWVFAREPSRQWLLDLLGKET